MAGEVVAVAVPGADECVAVVVFVVVAAAVVLGSSIVTAVVVLVDNDPLDGFVRLVVCGVGVAVVVVDFARVPCDFEVIGPFVPNDEAVCGDETVFAVVDPSDFG